MRLRTPARFWTFALCTLWVVACGTPPVEERLTDIQELLRESRFDDAIAELREILDTEPENGRANLMLAMAFQRTNQPTLAVWPLEKAFNDPELQVRAGLRLGNLHLALSNPTDAIRVTSRLIESAPDSVEAHRVRARAYLADKRFDEALVDAEWLIETDPGTAIGLVLKGSILSDMDRYPEAEQAFREAIELTAEDPPDNERAWVVLASFLSKNADDPERAEATLLEARELHPDSPALRNAYLTFLAENDRLPEVEVMLREEIENEPESFQLRIALSANLRAQEREDEADAVIEQLTEDFPIATSWQLLGRMRLDQGDFEGASDALGKAVELAPQDEPLRFLLAEAVVRSGDLDAARALALTFERKPYKNFVEGLIALEAKQAAEALAHFEAGLRNWPDNQGARYNAGIAAQLLGDWKRAINEFTEAARVEMSATRGTADPFQTEAALQLARIYRRQKSHTNALYWARVHLSHHDGSDEAKLIIATTMRDQGSLEQARSQFRAMLDSSADSEARAELASLEFEAGNDAAAWKLLDAAPPGDLRSLSVAAEHDVQNGRLEAALRRVDRAQESDAAEEVELVALRGRVLHSAGRTSEAQQVLEKALALDPDHASTLAALATIRATSGDIDGAVEMFDRAAELEPESAEHPYHAAQLLLQRGRSGEAESRLRKAISIDPGQAEARNDLAWLLSSDPARLEEAYQISSEAYRLNDSSAFADTLGWIHYQRQEYPLAVDLLSRASKEAPDDATLRYHLGMALSRQGQSERALAELKTAVDTGAFSDADSARVEIARLEGVGS